MDELNPTVREQEIYEEMELTPEMVKSIRTLCGTCLRHLSAAFCGCKGFQNRACTQRRPEHGHLHRLPDATRLRLCGHAPLTQPYHHTVNEARCGTSGSGLCT